MRKKKSNLSEAIKPKSKTKVTIGIRVNPETRAFLKDCANNSGTSLSNLCEQIVKKWIDG
jgi:uncharacterized protein (DUF1778 family)